MSLFDIFSKKEDQKKPVTRRPVSKRIARLMDGRVVPKPNKTAPFRKGIF